MSKQELLKYNPKKSMRNELVAFAAFSIFVMIPMALYVVHLLNK